MFTSFYRLLLLHFRPRETKEKGVSVTFSIGKAPGKSTKNATNSWYVLFSFGEVKGETRKRDKLPVRRVCHKGDKIVKVIIQIKVWQLNVSSDPIMSLTQERYL